MALFRSEMIESKNNEINFGDINTEDLEVILAFIYTGRTKLTEENVIRILQYAHMAQLPILVKYCVELMVTNIKVKTCLQYKRISEIYEINDLYSLTSHYLSNKTTKVLRHLFSNENTKYLKTKNILVSLDDEGFSIDLEPELYENVRDWIKCEKVFRTKQKVNQKNSVSIYSDSMLRTKAIKTHLIIPLALKGMCLYFRDGDKTWRIYKSVRESPKAFSKDSYVCGDGIFVLMGKSEEVSYILSWFV